MRALASPCALLLGLSALAALGCDGGGPDCRVGADCASGICRADGTCEPEAEGGDGGQDGQDGVDEVDGSDGVDEVDDVDEVDGEDGTDGGDDGGPVVCQPNQDWVVERSEVTLRAGLYATFQIGLDCAVDTAGEGQPDGSRRWDLSGDLAGDHPERVDLLEPTGAWWAPDFPDATYAARLRDAEELLGVFQGTDSALLLLGVVSPEDGLYATKLSYDPPVEVLRFPLTEGLAWSTDTTVTGQATGVVAYYFEGYDNQVDARGELATPFGTFQVLRVRVELTRTVGMAVTTSRSFAFVAECFGTVALVHSKDYEGEVEFTQAAEVRRLGR
ncbi:MAG TPA: hypothetical protein PK668_24205 [Myxococcota bacterium]|nr:hypothetical protein [Myxococcota bacterium]HRY95366.1 hypothetical protein [Myxococcota bacterium]HSA22495.1 hypothetical protein [Myxococcota bacterium]